MRYVYIVTPEKGVSWIQECIGKAIYVKIELLVIVNKSLDNFIKEVTI
jgi:hypothetical protein